MPSFASTLAGGAFAVAGTRRLRSGGRPGSSWPWWRLAGFLSFAWNTRKLGTEWLVVLLCGVAWVLGAAFYFYMPLAGMTNPPMQWGYPRTVEGFIHAFSRGQYEKTNPERCLSPSRLFPRCNWRNMGQGIVEEFNWVYAFLALVPFLFFRKMQQRERAWLIGITAIYLCLGVLLLILLNPPADRAAQELNRVFFTASHTLVALLVGYGLTLVAAYMATHYQRFRPWGLIGGAVAVALAIYSLTELTEKTFFGEGVQRLASATLLSFVGRTFTNKDQYALPVYAGADPDRAWRSFTWWPSCSIGSGRRWRITLAIFASMPFYSDPDPLVGQRAAQPLVRLLVRPRHVHPAVPRARTASRSIRK